MSASPKWSLCFQVEAAGCSFPFFPHLSRQRYRACAYYFPWFKLHLPQDQKNFTYKTIHEEKLKHKVWRLRVVMADHHASCSFVLRTERYGGVFSFHLQCRIQLWRSREVGKNSDASATQPTMSRVPVLDTLASTVNYRDILKPEIVIFWVTLTTFCGWLYQGNNDKSERFGDEILERIGNEKEKL